MVRSPNAPSATREISRSTSAGSRSWLWRWVFMLTLLAGCLGAEAPVSESASPPVPVEHREVDPSTTTELLPNARTPLPGLVTGGQPSSHQLKALAQAGFKALINLREADERDFSAEIAEAEALGLEYTQIPVGGTDDLTPENAKALAEAMDAAAGPVAVHCSSGNRVGALLAVKAAWVDGATPDEALELGLDAGLAHLEPAVRKLLQTDPSD